MSKPYLTSLILVLALTFGVGCVTDDTEKPGDPDGSVPDQAVADTKKVEPPLTSFKVAALQYDEGDYKQKVNGCSDDLCGISAIIKVAAIKDKVQLVAIPEYATGQGPTELAPKVGDKPATDSRWADGTIIKTFAKLADDLNIFIVFNLITDEGSDSFNTNIAVDKDGKVVARHDKFELFPGEEKYCIPGKSVDTSFFDTPAGRAGMLICADIQCLVTQLTPGPSCTSHAVSQLKTFFSKKPRPVLVVFSAAWTIPWSDPVWGSGTVMKKLAKDGAVWVVGAVNTGYKGYGGGIIDPAGNVVASHLQPTPQLVFAELPLKK